MARLRPVKSHLLIKILQNNFGYIARSGSGRHIVLQDSNGHTTVIQLNLELGKGVLKKILNQTGLKWEEIERYL
jgi:predicted RNA binding protein YcfA (HicA-like mRNA interferase family)